MSDIKLLSSALWIPAGQAADFFKDLVTAHGFTGRPPGEARPAEAHHCRQVHGIKVVEAESTTTSGETTQRVEADGVYTTKRGECVAVKTADCLPVLFADRQRRAVMAVHAGWRGLTDGILGRAIQTLEQKGIAAKGLKALIGPAISREHYEVGSEVIEAMFASDLGLTPAQASLSIAKGKRDRWQADLPVAAVFALINGGLLPEHIGVVQACTYSEDTWHSYRRDGRGVGSNWSWIKL